jgi:glycosyltransferase involved in cell wall biosynthesis
MRKAVILQYRLLHYRIRLFELLRERCTQLGIDLHVVHGQPTEREAPKKDTGQLAWADVVTNRYADIGGKDVVWQPFPARHRDAALIVTMQENRLLSNYPLLLGPRGEDVRVAYWGHGRNFQSARPDGLRERWKRSLVGRVDWWFAYTELTRHILLADGYPDERITVLNNAIDNERFERDLAAVSPEVRQSLKREIGANANAGAIGLFCGSLYPDKRLDYMIAAADLIHAALPDFQLVVIGDGPSADIIRTALPTRPWLRWLGALTGRDKAQWFAVADLVMNPGAVGLHILDAFCSGAPMVTARDSRHGPELAYLENGVNGLIVDGDAQAYADAVISLLSERPRLDALKRHALADARRYSLGNMVEHFATGIERCMSLPRKP